MPFEVIRLSRSFIESPGFIRRGQSENPANPNRLNGKVVAGPFEIEAQANEAAEELTDEAREGVCMSPFMFIVRQVFVKSSWATLTSDGYGCP